MAAESKVWLETAAVEACFHPRFVRLPRHLSEVKMCSSGVTWIDGRVVSCPRLIVWPAYRRLRVWQIDLPENVKLSTTVPVKLPVRAICLVYTCHQGRLVDETNPHVWISWSSLPVMDSCLPDAFALIIPARGTASGWQWYYWINEWTEILPFACRHRRKTLSRRCIVYFITSITHKTTKKKLSARTILHWAYSLITFASPISMSFPGYGANSSRLLLYLQSPSPGVKLWMKPTWQGTELHKPPSVLSPGSQRLHYSVWGSFGCE